jgi:hypothetical protein
MVVAWFATLTLYYQTMRRPAYLIRFINGVQGAIGPRRNKRTAD